MQLNGTDLRGKGLTVDFTYIWLPTPPDTHQTAGGFAGCNEWHADMPPGGSHLFARLTVTEKICPDDGVMQVEKEFLTSLVAVTEIREEEDTTLTLIGEGVTIKLSRR